MSAQTCEAVYENGVLRPTRPLTGLKEGESVLLTVAGIITDPEELRRRHEEILERMKVEGLLETEPVPVDGPPPVDFKPIVIEGEPLSETIIKMRGER